MWQYLGILNIVNNRKINQKNYFTIDFKKNFKKMI